MLESVLFLQSGTVFASLSGGIKPHSGAKTCKKKIGTPRNVASLARDEDCTMTTRFCAETWDKPQSIHQPFDPPLYADFKGVLRLAKGIDHDEKRVRDWYLTVKIRELGDKTAQELVQMGESDLVIGFLRSIRRGYRD